MSLKLDSRTLWRDVRRTRYFLIPDDYRAPHGACVVWTAAGRRLDADEAALLPFEVTADEAGAWASNEFGGVLDAARTAVEDAIARMRRATQALRENR